MIDDIEAQIEAWVRTLPKDRATGEVQALVSRIWAVRKRLLGPSDPNRSHKQAALKAAIAREWETPRANGAHELADRQLALHHSCRVRMTELGAAGLYIPQTRRGYIVAMYAVWQLSTGAYDTPATTQPPCCFEQLHASLSLPRVPIAVDPAYLLTDF